MRSAARTATPPRRPVAQLTEYVPVRFTADELAAVDELAATPGAWPAGLAVARAAAVRQLVREALAARAAPRPAR